ncbi:MAG: hypothetical protein ACREV7_16115 [Steroidobacteraceae bacterium]
MADDYTEMWAASVRMDIASVRGTLRDFFEMNVLMKDYLNARFAKDLVAACPG